MKRSSWIAAGILLVGGATPVLADDLTIVSWGGAYSESQRKAYYEPYMKQGHKITEEEYNGEIAKIRAMVEANSVTWDVVDVDSQTAMAGCAEGIFEVIDWAKLGYDRANFVGETVSDCSVPTIVYSTVLAYDGSKMNPAPTTVNDLFDLAKFPGKRGLQKNPFVNLEWALIADGVSREDLYKVMATPEGIDRAFKKLDTIKSEVVWWEAGAQPPQMLADGQVVITSAWNGRITGAVKKDNKPFKIMWDHQAFDWDLWGIPKGTPKLDQAYAFLKFASSPPAQADQTNYIAYGPANKDAIPNVNKDVLPDLPTNPDNMSTAIIVDVQFWADNGEQLRERFNAWLAQ
ncbi:MAG: ABC transporter substrate-binding protein [Hyphomicrobiaceae bacterium]